jgi:hypothetical protein
MLNKKKDFKHIKIGVVIKIIADVLEQEINSILLKQVLHFVQNIIK